MTGHRRPNEDEDSEPELDQDILEEIAWYDDTEVDPKEVVEDIFYLEPRLWKAWEIFHKISSQWDVGMAGRTSLKGEVLQGYLNDLYPGKKKSKKRLKLFDQVTLISQGALQAWSDQVKKKDSE